MRALSPEAIAIMREAIPNAEVRALPIRTTKAATLLRETMLSCVGRVPKPAAVLFAATREAMSDDGLGERRLWRAVRWLLQRGAIRVIEPRCDAAGRRYGSDGYVRVGGGANQRRAALAAAGRMGGATR